MSEMSDRTGGLTVPWVDVSTHTIMTMVGDLLTELDRRGAGVHRGDVPAIPCAYAEIRPSHGGEVDPEPERWRAVYWDELSALEATRHPGDPGPDDGGPG